MSKKSNVHPDHYKTAGREPQGRAVIQEVERQKFREQEAFLEKQAGRRSPVPPANQVSTPPQNRSLDTASGQENAGEREQVKDESTKASAEKKPTRRVAGKTKASASKKPTRRVAGKTKASANKKPARRTAGRTKASASKKPARRVAGKSKASADKKPARRVAPRAARPKSKSKKKASKRAAKKGLRPAAGRRRK